MMPQWIRQGLAEDAAQPIWLRPPEVFAMRKPVLRCRLQLAAAAEASWEPKLRTLLTRRMEIELPKFSTSSIPIFVKTS
jgi:hypothetical protein